MAATCMTTGGGAAGPTGPKPASSKSPPCSKILQATCSDGAGPPAADAAANMAVVAAPRQRAMRAATHTRSALIARNITIRHYSFMNIDTIPS